MRSFFQLARRLSWIVTVTGGVVVADTESMPPPFTRELAYNASAPFVMNGSDVIIAQTLLDRGLGGGVLPALREGAYDAASANATAAFQRTIAQPPTGALDTTTALRSLGRQSSPNYRLHHDYREQKQLLLS